MEERYSIFDIAGPIMVGPSSSHTAGACKIGQYARALFNKTPKHVVFYLHGSFGEVYKGHATDKALLAGVMKFQTGDPRMKDSFKIAKEKGIDFDFKVKSLGPNYHPNTVRIDMESASEKMSVIGSSIGGGVIEIVKINDFKVSLRGIAGKYFSLVVKHDDKPAVLKSLTAILKSLEVVVSKVDSVKFRNKVLTVLSSQGKAPKLKEVIEMEKIEGVDFVRALTKLDK
ncbi:L-serine ammonia-lyase, iron-sulfur-dependent, subunit beta [Candidatus Peregrinibacteria bacterium]|nr:L-serine ammonia-lyase, iron-sulfur-dependent, subunit beta [Candidatus Peregrinibacteria bacterium]